MCLLVQEKNQYQIQQKICNNLFKMSNQSNEKSNHYNVGRFLKNHANYIKQALM